MTNNQLTLDLVPEANDDLSVPIFRVELVRERSIRRPVVTAPGDVAALLSEYLSRCDREHFVVAMLATNNRVIGVSIVHIGSVNASIVRAADVFKPAILANANAVVVAHNHPSGNLEPSQADVVVSKRLKEVGRLLEIELLDSLVIGYDGGYTSLAERGLLS